MLVYRGIRPADLGHEPPLDFADVVLAVIAQRNAEEAERAAEIDELAQRRELRAQLEGKG